jgi:hypothetical protein
VSLLLTGAKTITVAGTPMECIEIYTGEAYTLPFAFTNTVGTPINCTGWTLGTSAKFYTCNTVSSGDTVNITNLVLDDPQPTTGAGTYSANLTAAFTTIASGIGYIYLPIGLGNGSGTPNPTPVPTLTQTTTVLAIVTMTVTRTDTVSGKSDVNREPFGIIIRYQ